MICDSERDLRVGGVADSPASAFAGLSYVALGHLHGQQNVQAPDGTGCVRYSGSPLAFSFSERHHAKSVTLAEIDEAGAVTITLLPAPVPRPLRQVQGRLEDLLARADDGPAQAWVKAVLTDTVRPAAPMERLREKWPNTLVLEFAPQSELPTTASDLRRLATTADPVEICEMFVEFTSGGRPDSEQRAVLIDVVETAQHADAPDTGSLLTPVPGADESAPDEPALPGSAQRAA
jgi:exonuclease SbcD